jgi:hypothetical protein
MTLDGPTYSPDLPWYRGNLHCHTTESDGRCAPAEVMAQYRRQGYDFLALSDHDMLTRARPEEVPEGLLMIPALEAGVGPHVLCVNVSENLPKQSDRQAVIDATRRRGGLAVLNHPNWGRHFSHWDQEQMERLEGYAGIEIYNAVIDILEGSPYALDRWDRLLSAGKRAWGFAHDDSHAPVSVGWGWLMAQAEELAVEPIVEALRSGRFYASTGVAIQRIGWDSEAFTLRSEEADRIRFIGSNGTLLAQADAATGTYTFRTDDGYETEPLEQAPGLTARYRFRGVEGYVRGELLGRGGRAAWTQPVWVIP